MPLSPANLVSSKTQSSQSQGGDFCPVREVPGSLTKCLRNRNMVPVAVRSTEWHCPRSVGSGPDTLMPVGFQLTAVLGGRQSQHLCFPDEETKALS